MDTSLNSIITETLSDEEKDQIIQELTEQGHRSANMLRKSQYHPNISTTRRSLVKKNLVDFHYLDPGTMPLNSKKGPQKH
jgi:hypothetical protein